MADAKNILAAQLLAAGLWRVGEDLPDDPLDLIVELLIDRKAPAITDEVLEVADELELELNGGV